MDTRRKKNSAIHISSFAKTREIEKRGGGKEGKVRKKEGFRRGRGEGRESKRGSERRASIGRSKKV